jgi:FHA domain
MSQICPRCPAGTLYDDALAMCPKHVIEFLPPDPDPDPEPETGEPAAESPQEPTGHTADPPADLEWDRISCWHCGAMPPDETNTECLNPDCRRPLTPPALLLRFTHGEIEVDLGTRTDLGRLGPHSRVFRTYPNVSRRHAVVGVDSDGRAWIEPLRTPNGTFLDGDEIPAEVRHPLRTGHQMRLALHAEGTAIVYTR